MQHIRVKYIPSDIETDIPDISRYGKMGYFYCWGTDFMVMGDNMVQVTRAIVADEGGNVDMVYPMNVRFLDTPSEVLINNLVHAIKEKDKEAAIIREVNGFFKT